MADIATVLRLTADHVQEMDLEDNTASEPLIKLLRDAADCIDHYRKVDAASEGLQATQKKLIEAMREQIADYKELVARLEARHA